MCVTVSVLSCLKKEQIIYIVCSANAKQGGQQRKNWHLEFPRLKGYTKIHMIHPYNTRKGGSTKQYTVADCEAIMHTETKQFLLHIQYSRICANTHTHTVDLMDPLLGKAQLKAARY